jgi:alpha-beta hydrolase superfamily lysophospholipase
MFPDHIKSSDNLRLHVQHWPADDPRAVVMLIHGLAEHIARYEHVASAFNQAGVSVVGLDQRAHGKSEGEHRAHVPKTELLVDDHELLWAQIKTTYPAAPRFVMGHSMGGLIALQFTLRHQSDMLGLVVSGAGLTTRVYVPGSLVGLVDRLGRHLPHLPTVAFKSEHMSRSAETVERYDNDPLIERGPVRLGTAGNLLAAGQEVLRKAHTLSLPIYVLHGGADKIVAAGASKRLFAALTSEDKTLKIYPGFHHEILNEPEQDSVITDILDWLEAHLPT